MAEIPGVILAGGQATRMGGGDKVLLRLGGQTILARILERLAPQVGPVALNANGDPARFACFGLPVVPDTVDGRPGPLAGVLAAMDWAAAQGAAEVVTVAGDTPFFPADLVARLVEAARTTDASVVLAATARAGASVARHPTFGLWSVGLRGELRAALAAGTRRVQDWTEAQGAVSAVFPADGADPFFNINTRVDLARAEQILKAG